MAGKDDQQANADSGNAAGNQDTMVGLSSRPSRITGRIRILVIRPERALTWVRWTPKTTMTTMPLTNGQTRHWVTAVSGPADDSFPIERIVGPCVIRPDGSA